MKCRVLAPSRSSHFALLCTVLTPLVFATTACGSSDNSSSTVTGSGGSPVGGSAIAAGGQATTTGGTTAAWIEPTFDPQALPTSVPTVEIVVAEDLRAALDAAPFYGPDVAGAFIDGDAKRYDGIDVNYRGAYALLDLMQNDPIGRRNWKLKFASENRYRQRREWNYTFSPDLRQLLAYDLFRFAGVCVPSVRHVRLSVNGVPQGLYLEYEDPDNKDWLWDMFGDKQGDLYKAALDMPASEGQPEQKYFADTTYLGADDNAYPKHYNKKTNHEDPTVANDYSVLRSFLEQLNALPDAELAAWVESHLELDRFLSYLVVSNFISNWDSFPQRPKNFWLYEVRREGKLAFIPWDLDATFQQTISTFNQMGTKAPILFNLLKLDYKPYHTQEGTERPLAWRIIALPQFQSAYVARYRELNASVLSASYLNSRIDALAALVQPVLTDAVTGQDRTGQPTTERNDFAAALKDMRGFVTARVAAVAQQ
jgi:spore coat protein CotH